MPAAHGRASGRRAGDPGRWDLRPRAGPGPARLRADRRADARSRSRGSGVRAMPDTPGAAPDRRGRAGPCGSGRPGAICRRGPAARPRPGPDRRWSAPGSGRGGAFRGVLRSRIGSGRARGSGSKPGMTSTSIGRPSSRSISARSLCSSTQTSEIASPVDARPAGPADAVDVVLGDHRQLVVDDVGKLLDVDAAGGDLGRDEDRDAARLEVIERPDALRLARLPWIAAARMPSCSSCSARRLAPCLVRVKTRAWSTRPERDELRGGRACARGRRG